MIVSIAAAALAAQLIVIPEPAAAPALRQNVQYHVPAHPPPCGHGWDLSARDGLCYPNGYLPPQDQAARRYQRHYRGDGRYPVPCGHGTDLDSRDGRCYPTGMVPPQFQQGRQYYGEGYYRRPPPGRYYYRD
ncbi:hypothetical protein [Bradyrhizobium roseum]|uniref:hypothetical protein n=1 Tax=Bradyrhizobium roseum TaxID=3056648 RepID=UPI002623AFB2|nr:hypothetical protein [Bradyrhizobium roseus]WKA31838.1 hypothetical protein QUH67_17480 [Bradyrhizobium roseus]